MTSPGELNELHLALRSDGITKRKNALKQLGELLQSADFARILDVTTRRMDAANEEKGGDIKATWAGLAGSVMICVATEIKASHGKKKKPLDKTVTSVLRRLVAAAEDAKRKKRSGVVAPLRRRAGKLFTHVFEVLREGPPEFTTDYTQMLRVHLLAEPQYCARAKAITYEGIIAIYKERVESAVHGDDGGGGGGGDGSDGSGGGKVGGPAPAHAGQRGR